MKLTSDAHKWHRKWSTWLSMASLSLAGAATYFVAAPPEWKADFPSWLGFALLGAGMLLQALVPVATSLSQSALEDD